jgi:hypothetical protein
MYGTVNIIGQCQSRTSHYVRSTGIVLSLPVSSLRPVSRHPNPDPPEPDDTRCYVDVLRGGGHPITFTASFDAAGTRAPQAVFVDDATRVVMPPDPEMIEVSEAIW